MLVAFHLVDVLEDVLWGVEGVGVYHKDYFGDLVVEAVGLEFRVWVQFLWGDLAIVYYEG